MINELKARTKICPIMKTKCIGEACMMWVEAPSSYRKNPDIPCACKVDGHNGCEDCDYTGFALEEIRRGDCGLINNY